MKRLLSLLATIALTFGVASAAAPHRAVTPHAAATTTTTLSVTATVSNACSVSTTPISFGAYNYNDNNDDFFAQGTLSVLCTPGSVPVVALDNGGNFGLAPGLSNSRAMASGGHYLGYTIRQPVTNSPGASCTGASVFWGDGTGGTTTFTAGGPFSSMANVYNICGDIVTGQAPAPGSYSDTVNVTATF